MMPRAHIAFTNLPIARACSCAADKARHFNISSAARPIDHPSDTTTATPGFTYANV